MDEFDDKVFAGILAGQRNNAMNEAAQAWAVVAKLKKDIEDLQKKLDAAELP